MTDDEVFAKLTDRIDAILDKLSKPKRPIEQYSRTRNELLTCDVSTNQEYRDNFAQFYRLGRRTQGWKDHYFSLLEQSKHDPATNFAYTLAQLKQLTKRVEPSFASKLVATIDPQQPVIDSVVLGVLGYKQPYYKHSDRCGELVKLHQVLANRLQSMIADARFAALSQQFRLRYPDHSITDVKVLDFMLWQLREPLVV